MGKIEKEYPLLKYDKVILKMMKVVVKDVFKDLDKIRLKGKYLDDYERIRYDWVKDED